MAITWAPFSGSAIWTPDYSGTTHTFSGLNGGTNFPSGSTVVGIFAVDHGDVANFGSPPTVGGNAMDRCAGNLADGSTSSSMEIWYYDCSSPTTDSITIGNGSQYVVLGCIGGYLTGVATGGPSVNSEQEYGQQESPQNLSLTPANGGIGIWGFVTDVGSPAVPVWANVASSSSDIWINEGTSSPPSGMACNHAAGTGSSIEAEVTPTSGGTSYNYLTGMIAAGWTAAAAGAAPFLTIQANITVDLV